MAHQWDPEWTIEPQTALRLIKEQFPELSPENIHLLGAGWDNTAFIIDETFVFRFPRREISLPLLETEWVALPKLAPHLPVPIPVPTRKGASTPDFPHPFIGYRMLPGHTACGSDLSEEERVALAKPIAKFLFALHSIPKSEITGCPIHDDNRNRIDGSLITANLKKTFEELSLLGLLENGEQLAATVENLQYFREPAVSCIVHGDFYVRHLLVHDSRHLSGVIDWGDVHVGDPAIDLAIMYSFLPPKAHKTFLETYGPLSKETLALAKLRALLGSSFLVLFGHHSNDRAILREGLRSLKMLST